MSLLIQPVTDKALLPKGVRQFAPADIVQRYDYSNTLIMVKNFALPEYLVRDGRSNRSCAVNARMMMLCCLYVENNKLFDALVCEDRSIENDMLRRRTYDNDCNMIVSVKCYIDECIKSKNHRIMKDYYIKFAEEYLLNPNTILPDADTPVGKQFYQTIYIEDHCINRGILKETIKHVLSKQTCNYFIIASCESIYLKDGSIAGRKCFHEAFLLKRLRKNKPAEWIIFDDCSPYDNGELILKY